MSVEPAGYLRRLSAFDATMVVVGSIIGAGIFLNPAIVAARAGSARLALGAWVLGGVVALAGALCFGALGAHRPRAGGGYVYLRETFGPLTAFLYGWTLLLVINTGGVAAVATTFASYTADLLRASPASIRPLAVGAIVLLTGVNCLGIRPGSVAQNVLTLLKLAALAFVVVLGLGAAGAFPPLAQASSGGAPGSVVGTLGVALIPVLFAYGGWQQANHIGAEVRDPRRNLPRALVAGVFVVVATYLLVNLACLRTLGLEGLATSTAPASDVVRSALGPRGATLIGAGIAVSTFGFVHISLLAGARVYQAMAADGMFFSRAAVLDPRFHVPTFALVVQGVWAIVLVLSGTYGQLLDWVVFGDWIFFGLVAATLFVYRHREGARLRVPGWPVVPLGFVGVALFAVGSSVASNPRNALAGAALILAGVPAYLAWRRGATPRADT